MFLEVPDPPSEILAQDVSSRGATLSWNVPYTGNSPVTKYLLQWKSASGKIVSQFTQVSIFLTLAFFSGNKKNRDLESKRVQIFPSKLFY